MTSAEYGRSSGQIPPIQDALCISAATPEQLLEKERLAAPQTVFSLPEIMADIQASAEAPTHEERTRVLIDTPDHVTIVSSYQPGEGEDFHAHPTHNTLFFLAGVFDLWVVNRSGEEEHHETYRGMMVALGRGQPQCRPGRIKRSFLL